MTLWQSIHQQGVREGSETLNLELNPFDAGKLPDSFKNLTKLTTLWLGACNLTDDFPSYVTDMSEMVWLDLSANAFTGSIPPLIWNLTKLQVMYIFRNNLTGDVVINGAIGAAGLIEIDLSFNMLTGVIPERIGTLLKLIKLCMSGNGFSDEIPASLAQLPPLVFLWIFNNKLNGALPPWPTRSAASPRCSHRRIRPPHRTRSTPWPCTGHPTVWSSSWASFALVHDVV
ncbi:Receptor protein kinase CLAVATA1 [Hordeum vulgare]|nr:Receptor protein kinase CLAVATA1 [Hordeum vulgare]